MNVWKKLFSFIVPILVIFIIFSTIMFSISRRNNIKATEVKKQLSIVTETIVRLKLTIKNTRSENAKLNEFLITDRDTITKLTETNTELEQTNRKIASLVILQRNIIKEITSGSEKIRGTGGTITIGLGDTIKEIDKLIEFIKNRKN